VERFEDLIAWQKARALTRAISEITGEGAFSRDFELSRQMRRTAISIMSNIAEGAERSGASELHHFLTIAKASCAELRSQLYIALDASYLDDTQFGVLLAQAEETGRVIGGLRVSIERARNSKP
jgi:four helix bundle protein